MFLKRREKNRWLQESGPIFEFYNVRVETWGVGLRHFVHIQESISGETQPKFLFFFFSFFERQTEISYDETNRFVLFFFVFSWHFRLNNYVIIKSLLKKWPQKYERKKRTYVNMHLNDQTSEVYIEAWSLIEINACKIWKEWRNEKIDDSRRRWMYRLLKSWKVNRQWTLVSPGANRRHGDIGDRRSHHGRRETMHKNGDEKVAHSRFFLHTSLSNNS